MIERSHKRRRPAIVWSELWALSHTGLVFIATIWRSALQLVAGCMLAALIAPVTIAPVTLSAVLLAAVLIAPLQMMAPPACAQPPPVEEQPEQLLFNGRDLSGWWTPGNLASWRAEHGELVCLNQGGNYLRSEREFGDFELTLEYLAAPGCNSGIGIRTPREGWPSGDGIELQIYDQPGRDKHSTMALYGNVEPLDRADRSNDWNYVRILAEGPRIRAWVNGTLVQDADTSTLPELQHRHRRGWIGFQDHGGAIRFREIRLRELPPAAGASSNVSPDGAAREPALAGLLDRIMNTRRLAQSGALESTLRSGRLVAGKPERVELTGPGALVGLFSTDVAGMVSLTFDGETMPRVRAQAQQLHAGLPRFADDPLPIVTCVPYSRELIITFDPASDGEYHLAFATGKPGESASAEQLASFTTTESNLPRGYQPAIEYRLHQFDGGTHREQDPYPRHGGQVAALDAGAERELLAAPGSGVALWFKLLVPPEQLATDDLWLKMFVDGEAEPAISAPARFLFPGAAAGSTFPNFVVVLRGGPTTYLAMPFSNGLRVVAENRGRLPLAALGAIVSVAPAPVEATRLLARLRGSLAPAGSGSLLSRGGAGRLVSLVIADPLPDAEQPRSPATARLAGLLIDGAAQPALAGAPLATLLGQIPGEGEFRRATTGRSGGLAWRHFLLDAVPFAMSIEARLAGTDRLGARLALYYVRP